MNSKTILGASLAAIFVCSMILPAYAGNPMHVISGTVDSGNIVLTTAGHAGNAVPDEVDTIFAYVAITDEGIFAATSHFGTDDPPVSSGDLDWHTHEVTLDDGLCVVGLATVGDVEFDGDTVIISGTGATSVNTALGAKLKITEDGICVTKVF